MCAERHHARLVQRCAYRLWIDSVQHRLRMKDERLAQIEQRAIVLGHKRALRFWLSKWKEHQAIHQTEKRASVDIDKTSTHNALHPPSSSWLSLSSSHFCVILHWGFHREELKQETWKKVHGWLSSYRAVSSQPPQRPLPTFHQLSPTSSGIP